MHQRPQPTFSEARSGPPGQTLLSNHPCVHPCSRGLTVVVPCIGHHHMAIRGHFQSLCALRSLCRCVVGQEGAGVVGYLDVAVAQVSYRTFPLEAVTTPMQELNCPLPSPWKPNMKGSLLAPYAFNEWVWKSITTISFLFTATESSNVANQLVIGRKVKTYCLVHHNMFIWV